MPLTCPLAFFLNQSYFDAISIFASILSEATIYIFPVAFLNQSYFDAISIFASILSEATIYNNYNFRKLLCVE